MYTLVSALPSGVPCSIKGYGHTEVSDDLRFRQLSQEQFITDMMSPAAIRQLLGSSPPWPAEDIKAVAEKWVSQTGIYQRIFFSGSTAELAVIAARKCLAHAGVSPAELDVIVAGSNTGPGYPSLADHIKFGLGQASRAMAYDVEEACPVGCVAVFNGWNMIRSGVAKYVLVVCAEKATTLAPLDDWKSSNLFGDAAFAYLLAAGEREAFLFFDIHSLPFNGQLEMIMRTPAGFAQNGLAVHKFVGTEVVRLLVEAVAAADITPASIKHLVPHQPSAKTLDLLEKKLRAFKYRKDEQDEMVDWSTLPSGIVYHNVEFTGNTSGASTGSIISKGVHEGLFKSGDRVVVTTFGAGLSVGNYGFVV